MASMKREIVTGLNVIFGLLLIGWPFMALFTVNLAEDARALQNGYMLAVLLTVWPYPFLYLVALAWSRAALTRNRSRRHAIKIALLPAINLALVLIATVSYWGHCGGRFGC
ncbi:hypothetical protein GCM10025771_07540 [Niveibacterium umoris]|uniref:Uncharacterized SAM-binding protein YcdF (DUF218 family) n=1 Tax=Niveibacterium umoris TaxID=1193620 RepID=A0A840BQE9_9RHOO|nr:hypothetical protein [Niveibacterium umoris]MBB4013699.1 uncharacterized SAM-binding protein YcdF (DUF218 family) [Niveibacterium umoris]